MDQAGNNEEAVSALKKVKKTVATRGRKRKGSPLPAAVVAPPQPKVDREFEEQLMCAVCHETLRTPTYSVIPCLHKFCETCIRQWKRVRSACPTCQAPIDDLKRDHWSESIIDNFYRLNPAAEKSLPCEPWVEPPPAQPAQVNEQRINDFLQRADVLRLGDRLYAIIRDGTLEEAQPTNSRVERMIPAGGEGEVPEGAATPPRRGRDATPVLGRRQFLEPAAEPRPRRVLLPPIAAQSLPARAPAPATALNPSDQVLAVEALLRRGTTPASAGGGQAPAQGARSADGRFAAPAAAEYGGDVPVLPPRIGRGANPDPARRTQAPVVQPPLRVAPVPTNSRPQQTAQPAAAPALVNLAQARLPQNPTGNNGPEPGRPRQNGTLTGTITITIDTQALQQPVNNHRPQETAHSVPASVPGIPAGNPVQAQVPQNPIGGAGPRQRRVMNRSLPLVDVRNRHVQEGIRIAQAIYAQISSENNPAQAGGPQNPVAGNGAGTGRPRQNRVTHVIENPAPRNGNRRQQAAQTATAPALVNPLSTPAQAGRPQNTANEAGSARPRNRAIVVRTPGQRAQGHLVTVPNPAGNRPRGATRPAAAPTRTTVPPQANPADNHWYPGPHTRSRGPPL